MTASKKGVSAHQVHRTLGVSYKSTWFMMHRLREAMRTGGLEPLGGKGKVVEADETYFGASRRAARLAAAQGPSPTPSAAHVSEQAPHRCPGRAWRQRPHLPCCRCRSGYGLRHRERERRPRKPPTHRRKQALQQAADGRSPHETVKHTAANTFAAMYTPTRSKAISAIFKRGMSGIYQHCAEKHLHRYLRSSISATTTALRWASTTRCAPRIWRLASLASA